MFVYDREIQQPIPVRYAKSRYENDGDIKSQRIVDGNSHNRHTRHQPTGFSRPQVEKSTRVPSPYRYITTTSMDSDDSAPSTTSTHGRSRVPASAFGSELSFSPRAPLRSARRGSPCAADTRWGSPHVPESRRPSLLEGRRASPTVSRGYSPHVESRKESPYHHIEARKGSPHHIETRKGSQYHMDARRGSPSLADVRRVGSPFGDVRRGSPALVEARRSSQGLVEAYGRAKAPLVLENSGEGRLQSARSCVPKLQLSTIANREGNRVSTARSTSRSSASAVSSRSSRRSHSSQPIPPNMKILFIPGMQPRLVEGTAEAAVADKRSGRDGSYSSRTPVAIEEPETPTGQVQRTRDASTSTPPPGREEWITSAPRRTVPSPPCSPLRNAPFVSPNGAPGDVSALYQNGTVAGSAFQNGVSSGAPHGAIQTYLSQLQFYRQPMPQVATKTQHEDLKSVADHHWNRGNFVPSRVPTWNEEQLSRFEKLSKTEEYRRRVLIDIEHASRSCVRRQMQLDMERVY